METKPARPARNETWAHRATPCAALSNRQLFQACRRTTSIHARRRASAPKRPQNENVLPCRLARRQKRSNATVHLLALAKRALMSVKCVADATGAATWLPFDSEAHCLKHCSHKGTAFHPQSAHAGTPTCQALACPNPPRACSWSRPTHACQRREAKRAPWKAGLR